MGCEHIENIKALEVTALADPHATSRQKALALLAGAATQPQGFDHYQTLLDSGLCDAVVIASPNHTHAEVGRAALATEAHLSGRDRRQGDRDQSRSRRSGSALCR